MAASGAQAAARIAAAAGTAVGSPGTAAAAEDSSGRPGPLEDLSKSGRRKPPESGRAVAKLGLGSRPVRWQKWSSRGQKLPFESTGKAVECTARCALQRGL